MNNNNEILEYQKEQKLLKKEVEQIKKAIPIYLTSIIFVMFLLFFLLESKLYSFFGGIKNFIIFCILLSVSICGFYVYLSTKKIKQKEKLSKNIGSKIYNLMKLEDE
ncbi:hypothetical protein OBPA_19360 [Polaribacter sp. OB-PA-B3]